MEEVQSWWEVPAIAHFYYVFKSEFNLLYFEIAELESAILNIQDPDMSISLEQMLIKLVQGFYDETVTEDDWEEKIRELFDDNLEDDENPFEKSVSFFQLTPRQKVEVMFSLCELRLDMEGAMEDIRNIPSEDMQAKIIGKDSRNNTYWYFYDERLYKEACNEDSLDESPKNKNAKKSNKKQTKEKKGKGNSNGDKLWTVACFNVSDWENLIKEFSKSRISQEKQLVSALKNHLPLLEESVAEKDRMLRKRYMETAPKRSSSRISKVQAKKKIEEQRAEEEARQAKLEAEKERARKEALLLKEKKESRQKRAEERHRLMEERAQRARLRELAKSENNNVSDNADEDDGDISDKADDSDEQNNTEDQDTSDDYVPAKSQSSRLPPRTQRNEINTKSQLPNRNERSVDKKIKLSTYGYLKNSPLIGRTKSTSEVSKPDSSRFNRTYIRPKLLLSGNYGVGNNSSITYRIDPVFEQKIAAVQAGEREKTNDPTLPNVEDKPASTNAESCDRINFTSNNSRIIIQNNSPIKLADNAPKAASIDLPLNKSGTSQDVSNGNVAQKFTVYKTVIQNTSNVAKWHAAFGSKEQKVHIVPGSYGSASPKKLKFESPKSFQTVSPNAKSTISRENHIFKPVQTAFITYGKIIPTISSPAIVKLEYRKPPNPPVSS